MLTCLLLDPVTLGGKPPPTFDLVGNQLIRLPSYTHSNTPRVAVCSWNGVWWKLTDGC